MLALDLRGGVGPLVEWLDVPGDVEVRPADDMAGLRLADEIDSVLFDWTPSSQALLEYEVGLAREGLETGRWSLRRYVAVVDGRVQGQGGVGLVPGGPDGGRVARLFGGGVLPEARGRGAYRALLAARCAFAASRARPSPWSRAGWRHPGPILRRAGFAAYGQERCYETRLVPGAASRPRRVRRGRGR